MDLAQYYGVLPTEIEKLSTRRLSIMVSAMVSNRAAERIRRIEEIGSPHMSAKTRDKFLNSIFKQIDEKYKDPHMVSVEELKGILGNVGY